MPLDSSIIEIITAQGQTVDLRTTTAGGGTNAAYGPDGFTTFSAIPAYVEQGSYRVTDKAGAILGASFFVLIPWENLSADAPTDLDALRYSLAEVKVNTVWHPVKRVDLLMAADSSTPSHVEVYA